jgi:hypothetical protein
MEPIGSSYIYMPYLKDNITISQNYKFQKQKDLKTTQKKLKKIW